MAPVFAANTMRGILPQVIEATCKAFSAQESSDGAEVSLRAKHTLFQAKEVCDVALERLNTKDLESRSAAREALVQILLSEPSIEPTGDFITALLHSWRSDLVSALQATDHFTSVRISGNAVAVTPRKGAEPYSRGIVENIVAAEHEHTDWLVGLLITRAVAFRHDVDDVATELSDFSKQRARTTVRVEGLIGPDDVRVGLKPLSLEAEQLFLDELQQAVERDLQRLAQEPLPPEVVSIVREQIFTPYRFPILSATLSGTQIHPESLPCELPPSEQISSVAMVKDIRSRASDLMRATSLQSSVFHERATYDRKRCIPVNDIPPFGASRLLEITRIVGRIAEELEPIVKEEATLDEILLKLTDCLHERGLNDPTVFSSPIVLSAYIDQEKTVSAAPYLLLLQVAPQSGEAPTDEDKKAGSSEEGEPSSATDEEATLPQGEDDTTGSLDALTVPPPGVGEEVLSDDEEDEEAALQQGEDDTTGSLDALTVPPPGVGEEVLSDDEEAAGSAPTPSPNTSNNEAFVEVPAGVLLASPHMEPLSFQTALLRGIKGKDLLPETERLVKWFTLFEAILRDSYNGAENSKAAESDAPSGEAAWKYYGLSHTHCDEICRDFLELIADSYPEVWEMLPLAPQGNPTICDISIYSPIQQCFDVATLVNSFSEDIKRLSAEERENVRRWLVAFDEEEDLEGKIPTVEFLLSIEQWPTAAACYIPQTEYLGTDSASELDEYFGPEDFKLEDLNKEMLGKRFYRAEEHLLMNSLTQQGRVTLRELLKTGHIFLEGVSTDFIHCLNEVPVRVLQKGIAVRAEEEFLRTTGAYGVAWYESPSQKDYSTRLALRSMYSGVWADLREKYHNKRK